MYKQRIVSYYDKFTEIKDDLDENITDVVIVSFKFQSINNCRLLTLNDENVQSKNLDSLWNILEDLHVSGKDIHVMISGTWNEFFEEFEQYYTILFAFLDDHLFIKGVNLSINEKISTEYISDLMFKIRGDFCHVKMSLSIDSKDVMNETLKFNYDEFLSSTNMNLIDWICVFFLDDFNYDIFVDFPHSKYDKLLIGLDGKAFENKFYDYIVNLEKISKTHIVNGVAIWDYSKTQEVVKWGKIVNNIIEDDSVIEQRLELMDFYGKSIGGMIKNICYEIFEDIKKFFNIPNYNIQDELEKIKEE